MPLLTPDVAEITAIITESRIKPPCTPNPCGKSKRNFQPMQLSCTTPIPKVVAIPKNSTQYGSNIDSMTDGAINTITKR